MPHTPPTAQKRDQLQPAPPSYAAILTRLLTPVALAGTSLFLGSPASALVVNFSGNTTGQNTWQRLREGSPPTSLSGNAYSVPYQSFSFTVPMAGDYEIKTSTFSPPSWDGFLFLYQDSFDPLDPFQGVLHGNDETTDATTSGFTHPLIPGQTYFIVQTGYYDTDSGPFTGSINGPGLANINGYRAPVPGPLPLLGAVTAFGSSRKLRKRIKSSKLPLTNSIN